MELLSQRGYARRRGCSQTAVWKAIEAGRISVVKVGTGFKINPETADREWSDNTDRSKSSNTEIGDPGRRRSPGEPPAPMDLDRVREGEQIPLLEELPRAPARESRDNGGNGNGGRAEAPEVLSYARSRAQREAALARKAELELEEHIGSLVRLSEVQRTAFDTARKARDLLLAIPERIAPVLAAMEKPAEILAVLETEFERICGELSNGDAERS